MAKFGSRPRPPLFVLQNPLRRIVQVIELTPLYSNDEEDGEDRAQENSDGEVEEDGVHWSSRLSPLRFANRDGMDAEPEMETEGHPPEHQTLGEDHQSGDRLSSTTPAETA